MFAKHSTYLLLFSAFFLFSSCATTVENDDSIGLTVLKPVSEKRYEGPSFSYSILLPDCYVEELYDEIGIKNKHLYSCDWIDNFFSIDFLSSSELEEYTKTVTDESSALSHIPSLFPNEKNNLLSTVLDKRLKTLSGGKHSEISKLKLDTYTFDIVVAEGHHGYSTNEIVYYYAYLNLTSEHVLIQFVSTKAQFYKLLPDFNIILNSLIVELPV